MATAPTITYQYDTGDGLSGGSGETILNMPATRPDDLLYLAILVCDGTGPIDGGTSAWTEVYEGVNTAGSFEYSLWWKIGASEPATYAFERSTEGTENYNTGVVAISDADTTTPIGATNITIEEATAGVTLTAPAITATSADSLILRLFWSQEDVTANDATEILATTASAQSTNDVTMCWEASPGVSTTTGTSTATQSQSFYWAAATVEIMPAVSVVNTDILVPTGPLR